MTDAHPSLTQRSALGMAWMSTFQVTKQLLSVVTVSILARRIPPSAYGVMGMAMLVTNLLETIRDVGTGTALIREREMSDELASTGFWLNLTTGLAITLLVIWVSYPASLFFHEPMVAPVLLFLSLSFLLGAVGAVPTALLNRAMDFRRVTLAQAAGSIMGAACATTIALLGGKISALVTGTLVNSLSTTLAVWIFAPFRLRFVFNASHVRRIFRFGLNVTGVHTLNYFARNSDNVIVGRFLGSGALGIYEMAYMLMMYPLTNFVFLLAQVAYPAMATFGDDFKRLGAAYTRICQMIALVTFPVLCGLAVTAPAFVRVFLGPKWMSVASLLLIFAPLGALQSVAPVALIYNTIGRPDINVRWTLFSSTAYVLSFFVGLRWGMLGIARCYALVWVLLMPAMLMIPFRLIKLSVVAFVRALWPTIWSTLVMVAVAEAWLQALRRLGVQRASLELITTVMVGAVTYVALVWWQRPPVLAELSDLTAKSSNPIARVLWKLLPPKAKPARIMAAQTNSGTSG